MKGPHHGHDGSYNTCREEACRAHRLRYNKKWRYDHDHGRPRLVDGTPVRNHIATLRGLGWSIRAIAGASGVSATTISKAAKGEQVQVRTHRMVLAVSPDQVPITPSADTTEVFVSRVGTTRRLQALLWLGWRHEDMRKVCGRNTAMLLSQSGRWVTRSSHDAVAAMYRELRTRPGPSQATRTRARRMGFVSPLGWDDIDLDPEPLAEVDEETDEVDVDEVVVLRVLAGERLHTTKPEKEEIMRRWLADGRSERSLITRMGWKDGRYTPDREEVA